MMEHIAKKPTKEQLKKHFDKLNADIRKLRQTWTQKLRPIFEANNGDVGEYSLSDELQELENLVFFYARLHDGLTRDKSKGTQPTPGGYARGKMESKIRKMLGYTYY